MNDKDMVNVDTSFFNYLFEVTVENRVAQVKKHRKQSHRFRAVRALEVNHRHRPSILAKSPSTALHQAGLHA